jgi:hypothetical protein
VLYDADTIPRPHCTHWLVSCIAMGAALCASNPQPVSAKEIASRAAQYFSNWLGGVRREELSRYTIMGRALAVDSDVAKTVYISENIIAIDLYFQCKVFESGPVVEYNDDAIVYFQPTSFIAETASQFIRSSHRHRASWKSSSSLIWELLCR